MFANPMNVRMVLTECSTFAEGRTYFEEKALPCVKKLFWLLLGVPLGS